MKRISVSFIKQFQGWTPFERFLMALAIVSTFALTMLWGDNLFGASVTLTGILCVILVARGSIWNYFWGTYNVIGYAYIAYTWGLNGEVMLNALYFLPMQVIGFIMWKNNMSKDDIVKMQDLSLIQYIIVGLISTVAIIGYADFLNWVSAVIPWLNLQQLAGLDATSTVLSVVAMILMAKRYASQWVLWIVVDVVSVLMWLGALVDGSPDAPAMLIMWVVYLINAVYGYYNWKRA